LLPLAGCSGNEAQRNLAAGTPPAEQYQPSPQEIERQRAAEAAAIARQEAAVRALQAQQMAEQQRNERLAQFVGSILTEDSKSWLASHFVEGSVKDVSVKDGDEASQNYTVHATYSFASGDASPEEGWVDVKVQDGNASCLTYSSDPTTCSKVGGQNAWVTPMATIALGAAAEGIALSAADATHDCKTKATAHGFVLTLNEGIVEAGIDAISGKPDDSDPDAAARLQAVKIFVNGALEDNGLRGLGKAALVSYAQEQYPNDRFVVAYMANAADYYLQCAAEATQTGDAL
jgi:hypothetical protein